MYINPPPERSRGPTWSVQVAVLVTTTSASVYPSVPIPISWFAHPTTRAVENLGTNALAGRSTIRKRSPCFRT